MIQHQMKFKVVEMTPVWAGELLKNNHPDNRRKKTKRIEQFIRDMVGGFWVLTHQGVAVDIQGNLIDGQNRLEAVVESGCTVPMVFITGVPVKAMAAADYIATRSVADSARISGKSFGKNESAWASTARHMQIGMEDGSQAISHQEIIAFVGSHLEALEFSFELLSHNKRGLCSAPLRAVIARAWYKHHRRNRTRQFCEFLMSGLVENLKTDVAVIKLRNWLQDSSNRGQAGGQGFRKQIYNKTEEALRLFHEGLDCGRLEQAREEYFPLPEEL